MNTDLDAIRKTLVNISRGSNILDTLIEFERTLDKLEIFAYKNWILGELVQGPDIGRYWYKTVWMYPYSMMPDPDAGLRLTKIGAKVSFKKGIFKKPVKVKGPQDWVNPETKRAQIVESDIWLVTIELPIKYINVDYDKEEDLLQKDIIRANTKLAGAFEEEAGEEGVEQSAAGAAPEMGQVPDMGQMPPEETI